MSRQGRYPFQAALRGLIALTLAGAGVGCSNLNIPQAENYPASTQQKAKAVHHWNVLADDVANRIATRATGASVEAFHLSPSSPSTFNKAFYDLLLTRLVDKGVPMSNAAQLGDTAAAQIRFDVQVVQHRSMAFNMPPLPMTTLAVGLAVLRNIWLNPPTEAAGAAMGIASGAFADFTGNHMMGKATGGPTRTELLVSTSVEHEHRIVARTSDIYYIEAEDAVLFTPPPPPPAPPTAPTRNWKVIGS